MKRIYRIGALLLVPCLVADRLSASVFCVPLYPGGEPACRQVGTVAKRSGDRGGGVFEEQALNPREAVSPLHPFGIWVRCQYVKWAVPWIPPFAWAAAHKANDEGPRYDYTTWDPR